jgi:hypothetical protein
MAEEVHDSSTLVKEVASLFHLLGGLTPKHLVVVGGLVPPLLVPAAVEPHLGSADVDFCLSVAITKGDTSDYYRSLEKCIEPYFEPIQSGFRWRKKQGAPGISLLVDFMGPEEEATRLDDGSVRLSREVAVANTGTRLRPYPLAAAELIDQDALITPVEGVSLLYRAETKADVKIRHAGPVGFLASKADALDGRDDAKDGYDVSWWCLQAGATAEEVAAKVMARDAYKDPYFQESVAKLESSFRGPEYVGPDGYAREKNPNATAGNQAFDADRNTAFLRVSQVVALLRENLWS